MLELCGILCCIVVLYFYVTCVHYLCYILIDVIISIFIYVHIFTERISTEGNAIGPVRPSVRLFVSIVLNRVTFDLDLLPVYGS